MASGHVQESTDGGESPDGLRRVLGPVDATCVVVGAIIGVGIFFTPSRVAELAQSANLAMLAWAIGGGIALLGALTFAELGGLYPRSGGQYEALRDAYGPLPAFLFVFCNATAIQAGAIAIIAIICAKHLGTAVGRPTLDSVPLLVLSAALIAGLAAANAAGVRWGSRIQNATVFAKVGTLLVVTVLAATVKSAAAGGAADAIADAAEPTGMSGPVVLFAAMVPALFAYGGWQHALWMAGEVRRPERNVPLAIVGGVALVVTVYLLANWAYLHLLGRDGVAGSTALAADAVAVVWSGSGPRIVAAAVAVSAFGVLNAQLLSGPRLIHRMARDGRFFRPFGGVDPRFGTPLPAIVLLAGMALLLLFAAGEDAIDALLTGVVFIDGIFFVLTGAAVVVLRHRKPAAVRPVRVLGYPVVPALFVLGEVGVVAGAFVDPDFRRSALIGAAWIGAGLVCYLAFFRTGASGADDRHPGGQP